MLVPKWMRCFVLNPSLKIFSISHNIDYVIAKKNGTAHVTTFIDEMSFEFAYPWPINK